MSVEFRGFPDPPSPNTRRPRRYAFGSAGTFSGSEEAVLDLSPPREPGTIDRGNASLVVRKQAASEDEAERVERELRLRAHSALRAEGLFA